MCQAKWTDVQHGLCVSLALPQSLEAEAELLLQQLLPQLVKTPGCAPQRLSGEALLPPADHQAELSRCRA